MSIRLPIIITGAVMLATCVPLSGAETRAPAAQATFSKDIAPILQRSCRNCHHPNSIASMSLLTFKDARPWARSIKTRVLLHR